MEQTNHPLHDAVYSEKDVLELFGINKNQLRRLRKERELPCVFLSHYARVYIGDDVIAWLRKLSGD